LLLHAMLLDLPDAWEAGPHTSLGRDTQEGRHASVPSPLHPGAFPAVSRKASREPEDQTSQTLDAQLVTSKGTRPSGPTSYQLASRK
jgi:hypothetical protein